MNHSRLTFVKRITEQNIVLRFLLSALALIGTGVSAQTVLQADGPGNTYELINSVLAPGYEAVESAECAHPAFGRHIAEVWDNDLQKYVFEFYIHVNEDNDRCINFDRQRVEIKTYEPSPAKLKGVSGETVVYKWAFKIPSGFKPSSNFTHIHQVKAVGGDDDDPLFVLTARKGSPNKLELNYYESSVGDQTRLATADLTDFENTWVEVSEKIKIHPTNGTYTISIKKTDTGASLLSYSNSKLSTFRSDNDFIRPKWGIYRSLLSSSDLRDESIRFAYFSIQEEVSTDTNEVQAEADNLKLYYQNGSPFISFTVDENTHVEIKAYNITGQINGILLTQENVMAGTYSLAIDKNKLSPGLNIVSLRTGQNTISKKILIKN